MTKRGELYIVGGLLISTLISGLILTASTASAEDYTKSALIRVQAACTLGGTVAIPHTDTISNGTYKSEIGETVLSAVCNDGGGFGIYAIGYTDDTDGNNVMKHDTDSTFDIATGIATSGDTSNWAMKLTAVEDGANTPTILNGYDSYKAVPSDYVKVASYPNATADNTNVSFLTHYATYVSLTQHSGVYTGKVKYVMVHPATGEAPEKECPDFECAGEGLPYYPDPNDPDNSYHAMQDIQQMCSKVATPSSVSVNPPATKLIDLRDHKVYNIAKLLDGRCWMRDNLALDLINTSLSDLQGKTNATNESLSYLKGVSQRDPNIDPNGNYATNGVSLGELSLYGMHYADPKMWVALKDTVLSNDEVEAVRNTKYGILYNVCAASAGSYCYGRNDVTEECQYNHNPCGPGIDQPVDGQDKPNTTIDIDQDICPTGWRLPTGGDYDGTDGSEVSAMFIAYDGTTYPNGERIRTALRIPLAGRFDFDGGSEYDQGSLGYVLTSTWAGPKQMQNIRVYSNHVYLGSYEHRGYTGYSVHCIAKE